MGDTSWWVDEADLDDEQSDVIELELDRDHLVIGPPGSGKTNLLLLRATYLVLAGRPNVVVLVFTRSLRNFVMRGAPTYKFARAKVQTIMSWGQRLLGEHGVSLPGEKLPFVEKRRALARALTDLFDAKPALEKHLDCILVDEVQDCLAEEVDLFARVAKNVFLVGDHRQEVYGRDNLLASLKARFNTKGLTKHYRNGELICKAADAIAKTSGEDPIWGSCNYDESKAKSSVDFDQCETEEELLARLAARLRGQLRAYPDELLGVGCPRNEEVRRVRDYLGTVPGVAEYLVAEDALADADDERCIVVDTIHDLKGMEFRAMHIAFAETMPSMRATQKRVAYTGITRAKTALALYHVQSIPGYLEKARVTVAGTGARPSMSDLFPGKKK